MYYAHLPYASPLLFGARENGGGKDRFILIIVSIYSDKLGSFICAIRKLVVPLHRFPVGEPAARQICMK